MKLLQKLASKEHLSIDEMTAMMNKMMSGQLSDIEISGILTAMSMRDVSVDELVGGAKGLRNSAKTFEMLGPCLDTCGTGGDYSDTFNISTTVAFVVAAAGVPIVKHGNRSITSKSGSADVLERLGVNISLEPEQVKQCIDEVGMGFLFAPTFHPAMKYVMPVRRELSIKTIFNLLGPLSNPVHAMYQILGVNDEKLLVPFAETLRQLGVKRAMVVHGADGLDELTTTAKTKVAELKDELITEYEISPDELGLPESTLDKLKGGTPEENAAIVYEILNGKTGPARDIVVLNAGAGLYVAEVVASIKEGIALAEKVIDEGKAIDVLNRFVSFSQEVGE